MHESTANLRCSSHFSHSFHSRERFSSSSSLLSSFLSFLFLDRTVLLADHSAAIAAFCWTINIPVGPD